ncbi:hypothetical protein D3C72_2249350 [compost metagenome]
MFWALCSNSAYCSTLARLVILTMLMASLPTGGMMKRMAWGTMMRRSACRRGMPIDLAASYWPGPTESRPARTTSAV